MSISIDWGTKVITIPKADMTQIQTNPFEIRELDLDAFRLALKDLEDSDEGMTFPDTHRHNTTVTLAGITLARVIEIINGYTVTFEDGQYAVNAVGANCNLADVLNLNQVSLRTFNSAGLQVVTQGSGLSTEEHNKLMAAAVEDGGRIEVIDGAIVVIDGKADSIKLETDKIPSIKTETDKIPSIKTETDKIPSVKTETDKIPSIQTEVNKIQDIVDAVDDLDTGLLGLASDISFIKKVEGGKWAIVGEEMIFYDEDNVTEIMRFTITRDGDGNPIMRTRV